MMIRTTLSKLVMCSDLSFLLKMFYSKQGQEVIPALVFPFSHDIIGAVKIYAQNCLQAPAE